MRFIEIIEDAVMENRGGERERWASICRQRK